MIKRVNSWSKADDVPNLIAQKQVDKSMYSYGSHIPLEFYSDFLEANNGDLPEAGQTRETTLVYGDQEFPARLEYLPRKDRGHLRLELTYRGSPFVALLREQLSYSYEQLVTNAPAGIDRSPESIPESDREYVAFYKTGVPYRYRVEFIPRRGDAGMKDWPLPKSFADVWADLGRVLGSEAVITTLAAGKRNVVSWRDQEGIAVTTERGTDLLPKSWFEETWDRLVRRGVLTAEDLPGAARFRDAAVTAIVSQLPYVDYTLHPRVAIFYTAHPFSNNEISSTFGVGTQGGIRNAGRAPDTKQVVFITSGGGETEADHPYQDRWEGETFFYTGEGLTGDQELTRGNAALSNSTEQKFPLFGFQKLNGGGYRFLGRFKVLGINEERQPDTTGKVRRVYVFRMERAKKVAGLALPVESRPTRPERPQPVLDLAAVTTSFSAALDASHIHFGPRHQELVRSFIAGLTTKRLVILTGLSGSGKTQIALRFGDWLGKDRRLVMPVRPDWTGPDALFGYEDALQQPVHGRKPWYVPDVLKFMLKAAHDPDHPYLLVLDEMNLAHVERYFADFLSGIESDEPCLPDLAQDDEGRWLVQDVDNPKIQLPLNLFVVGTVNVDETTYMFSPKVLDRANTYEFRVATEDLQDGVQKPTATQPGPDELVRGFLEVAKDDAWQDTHPAPERQRVSQQLRQLHRLLAEGDFEFGHRVFYEANRYAAMLASAGNASLEAALDQQVYQKVLPRLHGSRRRLEPTLRALGGFCWDLTVHTTNDPGKAFDPEALRTGEARLPLSFKKVQRMWRSLQANQFTSFTE